MTDSVVFDAASSVCSYAIEMLSFRKMKVAGVSRTLRGPKRAHHEGRCDASCTEVRCVAVGRERTMPRYERNDFILIRNEDEIGGR